MGVTGYPWYSTAVTRTQRVFRHGYRAWRVPVPDRYLPRVPGCSHTRVAPYLRPISVISLVPDLPSEVWTSSPPFGLCLRSPDLVPNESEDQFTRRALSGTPLAQSWLHIAAPGLGPDKPSVLHNPQARPVLWSCTITTPMPISTSSTLVTVDSHLSTSSDPPPSY